jgi:hypothetical protein
VAALKTQDCMQLLCRCWLLAHAGKNRKSGKLLLCHCDKFRYSNSFLCVLCLLNAMYPKMAGGKKTISLTKVLVKDGNKKSLYRQRV